MTTGVGIAEPLLQKMLDDLPIDATNLTSTMLSLIDQEMAATRSYIDRHKGVGLYQDNCVRWGHHLEAYLRVHDALTKIGQQRS